MDLRNLSVCDSLAAEGSQQKERGVLLENFNECGFIQLS